MFGLTSFFTALKRLTSAVNESASLFDAANDQLRQRLAIDVPEETAASPETGRSTLLEHQPHGNGTAKTTKARSK